MVLLAIFPLYELHSRRIVEKEVGLGISRLVFS